jgi:HAD superfamily hydrolase (TIGR01509 family)
MVKALLFDLDGTLAETNSVHFSTWVETLKPHGIEVTWSIYRDKISGRTTPEVSEDLLPDLAPEEARKVGESKEASFRERTGELKPLPGLLEFVEEARGRGMSVALVTNAPKENVFAMLDALGLEDSFEPTVVAEDVGVGKPDPAPYNAALEALGARADEAVAFEDSPSGIASSVAAGIPTVGIASTHDPEELEKLGVNLVAQDFADPKLEAFIDDR